MSEATKVVGLVCAAGVGSRMGLGSPKQYMKFGSEAMLVHTVRALRAVERMGEIVKHLDIPTNLSQWNVSRDDLEPLVEAGMSVQRLLVNNMRTVTPEDARNIYLQIL